MFPVLVFDIETIPDVAGLRRLHGLGPDIPMPTSPRARSLRGVKRPDPTSFSIICTVS